MNSRIKILPSLIVFCSVGFLFKAYGVVNGVTALNAVAETGLIVQEGEQANTENAEQETGAQEEGQQPASASPAGAGQANPANRQGAAKPNSGLGGAALNDEQVFDPLMMDESEIRLLQDLSARRVQLDKRQSDLDTREKLLLAVEKNIDTKIKRLEVLQADISNLVDKYDAAKAAQYDKLVKTYETMKAKDAARIMEGLDLDIQIIVATRMKEKSIAPILAQMNPQSARQLTIELATWADLNKVTNDQ